MAMTKEERAEYMKKWRADHREQVNEYRREYYKFEKGRKAPSSVYHELHKHEPEYKRKNCVRVARWQKKHREQWNAYMREYRKRKAIEYWRAQDERN